MPLIEVENLSKIFTRGAEQIRALIEINCSINQGEFVAVTGPSGSGKSTLMYILGLLDRQSSGSYRFSGSSTDKLSDDERAKLRNQKIGFVFQSFHLLPRASALRNVAMPLVYSASYDAGYSKSKADELAKEALIAVGLGKRLKHLPNELSGGERQRVAIARALVNKPSIIFADEPTGNLDSSRGAEIIDLFRQLHEQGVTIVLVTHDPQIAGRVPRRLEMRDGIIERDAR